VTEYVHNKVVIPAAQPTVAAVAAIAAVAEVAAVAAVAARQDKTRQEKPSQAKASQGKPRQGKTTHVFPAILWRYPGDPQKMEKPFCHQSPTSFQHNHIFKF